MLQTKKSINVYMNSVTK